MGRAKLTHTTFTPAHETIFGTETMRTGVMLAHAACHRWVYEDRLSAAPSCPRCAEWTALMREGKDEVL